MRPSDAAIHEFNRNWTPIVILSFIFLFWDYTVEKRRVPVLKASDRVQNNLPKMLKMQPCLFPAYTSYEGKSEGRAVLKDKMWVRVCPTGKEHPIANTTHVPGGCLKTRVVYNLMFFS